MATVNAHVEAEIGGVWTDLVAARHVRTADGITIRRGLSSEGSSPEPSVCGVTLDNRDGRYSARNPRSPYYGQLGRNTPIRVSVDADVAYLDVDVDTGPMPVGGAGLSTPDAAALDVTGDIDLRVDADFDSWRPGLEVALVSKWVDAGNQRSYMLALRPDGKLRLYRSTTGADATFQTSVLPVPITSGRMAVRVTLDVDNGASGKTYVWYWAPTIAGPWTQLGPTWISPGTTTLFAGTAPARVGANPDVGAPGVIRGRLFAAQIRNGIGGTVVANPDLSALAHGVTSWADSAGRTWTVNGAASVSRRDWRFHGEVSAWPVRWDLSQRDVRAPITAAGIMRRLGTGAAPLQSVLTRTSVALPNLLAYWPCEDGSDAERLGSAVDGGYPMTWVGEPNLASDNTFVASDSLPQFSGAAFTGRVRPYTTGPFTNSALQVRALVHVPEGGAPNGTVLLRISTSGSIARWDLTYGTGGTLALSWWDREGDLIATSGAGSFNLNGRPLRLSVGLSDISVNCDWKVSVIGPADLVGLSASGLISGLRAGRISRVQLNPGRQLTDVTFGHVTVQSTVTDIGDVLDQLNGYTGETAAARVRRLCAEEGTAVSVLGAEADSEAMGPQRPLGLLQLLQECAAADGGQLYEPRDRLALAYRTRATLLSQQPRVALPYRSLSGLEPVEDDAAVVNDVTVSRPGGSSARAVQDAGALSVLPPPAGVGRYATAVEVNVARDAQLPDVAGRLRALGTVDEARYPSIAVEVVGPRVAGDAAVRAALPWVDVGDRVTVTGPPVWLPPETISQLVVGLQETIYPWSRSLALVTVPESPYRVAAYSGSTALYRPLAAGRYSSDGSTMAAGVTSSATSWSVATPVGPRWTTDAGQLPLDLMVAGEQVRVTAISGTSTPQTFTVTRAVNGISKAHAAGTEVRLFQPAIYG